MFRGGLAGSKPLGSERGSCLVEGLVGPKGLGSSCWVMVCCEGLGMLGMMTKAGFKLLGSVVLGFWLLGLGVLGDTMVSPCNRLGLMMPYTQ